MSGRNAGMAQYSAELAVWLCVQEESVDFLVASSPGSQSCVGESGSGKHCSPVTC
jgi:hypothetical protein